MKVIIHQKGFDSAMTIDLVTSLRILMDDNDHSGFIIAPGEDELLICRDSGLIAWRLDSTTINQSLA